MDEHVLQRRLAYFDFSSEACGNELLDEHVTLFLKEAELDVQDELVVRREIAPSGKSRAFVNDTPVNLAQLNQLSSLLVDLHQQFDTLELGESDFQREVLDALGGNFPALKTYRQIFAQAQATRARLQDLQSQKESFNKEFDYHQFQFNELEEANFKKNELERLFRDARLGRIHPANSSLSRELVAKVALGINPDSTPRWG